MHTSHSYVVITHACTQILTDDSLVEMLSPERTSFWRKTLWTSMVQCRLEFMCRLYEAPFSSEKQFCFGSLLFSVILRLDFQILQNLQAGSARRPSSGNFLNLRAQDMPYCVANRLCPRADAGPILDYSMVDLMTAIRQVRHAFTDCVYSPELLTYVELLELCASRFANMSGTLGMFDAREFRVEEPVAEDEARFGAGAHRVLYSASGVFLDVMWPNFLGMHRRVIYRRAILELCVDDDNLNIAQGMRDAEIIRDFILKLCQTFSFSDTSPTLKRCLLVTYLRPGEREFNALIEPGSTRSDAGLVSQSLGPARVVNIQANSRYTPVAGIKLYYAPGSGTANPTLSNGAPSTSSSAAAAFPESDLDEDPLLARYEPIPFGYCIHDFLKMSTDASPGAGWAQYYARCEIDIDADPSNLQRLSNKYPMVCQLFNAWQLVYRGVIYWFNSLTMSLAAWLRLLALQMRQLHSVDPNYVAAVMCRLYRNMIVELTPPGVVLRRVLDNPLDSEQMQAFICDGRWD